MQLADEGPLEAVTLVTIPRDVSNLSNRLMKLLDDKNQLRVCYAAGPTEFGLSRRLNATGIERVVIAPSSVPQQGGSRLAMSYDLRFKRGWGCAKTLDPRDFEKGDCPGRAGNSYGSRVPHAIEL